MNVACEQGSADGGEGREDAEVGHHGHRRHAELRLRWGGGRAAPRSAGQRGVGWHGTSRLTWAVALPGRPGRSQKYYVADDVVLADVADVVVRLQNGNFPADQDGLRITTWVTRAGQGRVGRGRVVERPSLSPEKYMMMWSSSGDLAASEAAAWTCSRCLCSSLSTGTL